MFTIDLANEDYCYQYFSQNNEQQYYKDIESGKLKLNQNEDFNNKLKLIETQLKYPYVSLIPGSLFWFFYDKIVPQQIKIPRLPTISGIQAQWVKFCLIAPLLFLPYNFYENFIIRKRKELFKNEYDKDFVNYSGYKLSGDIRLIEKGINLK